MKRRAFTLVELAIVIAILGILALYAIPKYQGMVDEARSAQAKAQLGTFRSALAIYYAKNGGKFPPVGTTVEETTAILSTIFAEGQVPTVEVTVNGKPKPLNTVAPGDGDGDATDDINDAGGWVYDVTSDQTQADVRINSSDVDPVTGKYWYEY